MKLFWVTTKEGNHIYVASDNLILVAKEYPDAKQIEIRETDLIIIGNISS